MQRLRPALLAAPLAALLCGSAAAEPPTLGDGLRAVGAFDVEQVVDPRLVPPPPSEALWPRVMAATGLAVALVGVAGLVTSGSCITRDGDGRCVDVQGSEAIWPTAIVLGLGATVTGSYWHRWTRLPESEPGAFRRID